MKKILFTFLISLCLTSCYDYSSVTRNSNYRPVKYKYHNYKHYKKPRPINMPDYVPIIP